MGAFREREPQAAGDASADVVVTVQAHSVRDAQGTPIQPAPIASPDALVSDVELRRERAGLARRYLELRGDLGGLLIEMARRERFNLPLLRVKAQEAVAVERRAREIDGTLGLRAAQGRGVLPPGTVPMQSMLCGQCSASIPADANFCAYCGTPTP
jgi:hypothetical protein